MRGYSRKEDIPIAEEQFIAAKNYFNRNSAREYARHTGVITRYVHGSGVAIKIAHFDIDAPPEYKLNSIRLCSSTKNKIEKLAQKAGLRLNGRFCDKDNS